MSASAEPTARPPGTPASQWANYSYDETGNMTALLNASGAGRGFDFDYHALQRGADPSPHGTSGWDPDMRPTLGLSSGRVGALPGGFPKAQGSETAPCGLRIAVRCPTGPGRIRVKFHRRLDLPFRVSATRNAASGPPGALAMPHKRPFRKGRCRINRTWPEGDAA